MIGFEAMLEQVISGKMSESGAIHYWYYSCMPSESEDPASLATTRAKEYHPSDSQYDAKSSKSEFSKMGSPSHMVSKPTFPTRYIPIKSPRWR